ncbi:phosphotransferase family protein [Paenibacillus glycinis]|uniref:Phosphotransferase n=1 Tax=Paenibacillus glycinis TaxID=2697035 RepID=A0ABW9XUH5_9BACL|nr:phosphotransferase [Paenibacillus glycinis]NBD26327.1 phosphotransferase [Paenibacillus glycinis]
MKLADIPESVIRLIGDVRELGLPAQGHTSVVALATTDSGMYIMKKCVHPLYREWLRKEHRSLRLLHSAGLPIPDVIGYAEEPSGSWLVMSYIEGTRLREFLTTEHRASKREQAIHEYGAALKRIHESPCPAELKRQGDWLDGMLLQARSNLAHHAVDGSAELLAELERSKPDPIEATLIHGDFTIDNVLVRDRAVVGVIDWSGAAFGDPRYDAALAIRPKPNAFERAHDVALFYEAYDGLRLTIEEYRYYEEGLYAFF